MRPILTDVRRQRTWDNVRPEVTLQLRRFGSPETVLTVSAGPSLLLHSHFDQQTCCKRLWSKAELEWAGWPAFSQSARRDGAPGDESLTQIYVECVDFLHTQIAEKEYRFVWSPSDPRTEDTNHSARNS
jgi:hypothetical protein